MNTRWLIGSLSIILGFGCSSIRSLDSDQKIVANTVELGWINGIPPNLKQSDGTDIYCESSAVTRVGDRFLIANDKPMPEGDYTPCYSIPVKKDYPPVVEAVQYEFAPLFEKAQKIEAFAKSSRLDLYFASTAFDRIKPNSNDWDGYNMIFYWEGNQYKTARLLFNTNENGVESSKSFRDILQHILGVPYFKVEGLAVLPNNQLIFGIRELGQSYQNFKYTFTLISVSFLKTMDGIIINPDWKKWYEFNPGSFPGINKDLGLSSIEYNEDLNSLVALSSFEKEGEQSETYIWMLPLESNYSFKKKPILVKDSDDKPYMIPLKGEGLSFYDKKTLFISFDEDRNISNLMRDKVTYKRENYQSGYGIVKLNF